MSGSERIGIIDTMQNNSWIHSEKISLMQTGEITVRVNEIL